MTSLKQKYFFLNCVCASVSTAVIAVLFYVCSYGFNELVGISARNLSALYTIGELKSLLWEEMPILGAPAYDEKRRTSFKQSAERVVTIAKILEEKTSGDSKIIIREFLSIHEQIQRDFWRATRIETPHAGESAKSFASTTALHRKAYDRLNEFSESVLIGSQEQQGMSIRRAMLYAKIALLGAIGLTLIILLFAYLYFKRHVVNPILTISSASLSVAAGDLKPIQVEAFKDEIGVLAKNFNYMIEELHRSSNAIRAERDAAEQANRAKSIFLANMSHELRTPMHGILSFARFGQQKFDSAAKEKLKTYFDEIYESGSRLMNLLNDLLDLSKLEAGKTEYAMKEADYVGVIEAVASEMKAFAEEKRIKLALSTAGQEMLGVFDETRIMQVLRNLLSNAIKFSETGTTVRLEITRREKTIICRVVNRGVGIPSDELESIFDKFVQSSKTKTAAGGTGLGLAICREIIQQHGGRIWAESVPNGETSFNVELPQSARQSVQSAA